MITAVSLFAGIGGIDLALQRAGIRVVAAVEIDSAARAVLARHFPDTTLFNDVTEVTGDQLRAAGFVPDTGLLAAGWPCQGNSVAGGRAGMDDPRSGLWRHVVRLLAETRPRWFLGENVPGLYSVNGGADIAVVRRDLAQLGYWWAERILDAQHFGVPQRRNRIFFVGHSRNRAAPVRVLLEPESSHRNPPPGSPARPGTTRAPDGSAVGSSGNVARALVGGGNDRHDESRMAYVTAVPVALRGRADGSQIETGQPGDPAFTLRASTGGSSQGIVGTLQGGGRRGHRIDAESAASGQLIAAVDVYNQATSADVAFTLDAHQAKGGQSILAHSLVGVSGSFKGDETRQTYVTHALTSEGADASEDGTGRGTPLVVAAPLTAGSATGPGVNRPGRRQEDDVNLAVNGAMVRRLTPLECERLQGFPDGWTAGQSDSARYRQLGNAVAVPVAQWIAERIAQLEHAEPFANANNHEPRKAGPNA